MQRSGKWDWGGGGGGEGVVGGEIRLQSCQSLEFVRVGGGVGGVGVGGS